MNIKYGSNGTGKSTISKAIYAKSQNNTEEINKLTPFGENDLPVIENTFSKVRVFDEAYVNSYLFKDKSFLENSYQVFLKSEECEKLSMQIALLLQELQGIFHNSKDIENLRKFIPQYFDAVKYKDGAISKKGGVGEFLKGNGGGFNKYEELKPYSAFYENRDMVSISKWAKWRNDGIQQMNGDDCPFCTHGLDSKIIDKQNKMIVKVFKNSALSTASAVLEFIQKGVALGFIKEDAIIALQSYIGNSSKEDDLYSELKQLALETEYLSVKIEKICSFKPMNVTQEQIDSIESNLLDMIIEERQISKFYTTEIIINLLGDIKFKIERLRKNTGQLKGLFSQHKIKMEKLIENRKEDINAFFALAGFPYEFILKSYGEEKASSYLVPANFS